MKKKNRRILLTTLMLTTLLIVAAASAQAGQGKRGAGQPGCNNDCSGGRHGGRGGGHDGGMMLKMLDLSDEQQAAIDKLRDARQEQRLGHRKEMMRLRNELDGLMLQDEPDAAKARKLITRMGELRTGMQVAGMEHRLAIRKLLTPEQRDKLITHQDERHGRQMGRQKGNGCFGAGPRGSRDCDGQGRRLPQPEDDS